MKTRVAVIFHSGCKRPISSVSAVGILAYLVLLGACTTVLPVRTDFDREADFSGYQTYTWMGDNPLVLPDGRSPEVSALNLSRIVTAIENELARKGYDKAAAGGSADFAVAITVGTRERIDVNSYPLIYRDNWRWRSHYWDEEIRTSTYEEGMLAIDIFDGGKRVPVWHGFTNKRITQSDMDDPTDAIREAVTAILARFPPG